MRTFYITFRSVTFAQRGERVLQHAGIRCSLLRTPKWMETQGCGYCLRLREKTVSEAVAVLREGNVPLRKIYVQREDRSLEEWGL